MSGPDPGPVDVVEVGAVPPYCRFKVLIRTSLPVRHLTVRRNARRCSRAWRVLPAARLVAADEDTVRDVIHAFNERGLAALAPRWAGGRPLRISERGHAEGEPTRANRRTYAATTGTAESAVRSANPAASAAESARSTRATATENHAAWRVRPTVGVTRSSARST